MNGKRWVNMEDNLYGQSCMIMIEMLYLYPIISEES